MREIDNNMNSLNFKGVQKTSADEPVVSQPQPQPIAETHEKEINDLKNMPALGKSQVQQDNVDKDMEFLLKNPEQVAQLNAIFDKIHQNHAQEQAAYEETAQLIDAYKNEFLTGKH